MFWDDILVIMVVRSVLIIEGSISRVASHCGLESRLKCCKEYAETQGSANICRLKG
jgi:hypothetical protein